MFLAYLCETPGIPYFRVKDGVKDGKQQLEITFVEHTKLTAMVNELCTSEAVSSKCVGNVETTAEDHLKRKREDSPSFAATKNPRIDDEKKKEKKDPKAADIMVCVDTW